MRLILVALSKVFIIENIIMIKKIVAFIDLIKLHNLEVKARQCVSRLEDVAANHVCTEKFHAGIKLYRKKSIELREILQHSADERRVRLQAFIDKIQNKYN